MSKFQEKAGSDWVNVSSGVPQGTVLGPLLFLVYINGSTCQINFSIKLFADDAVMYSEITTQDDISSFQTDINRLSTWSNTWQMNFNLTKYNIMTITRSTVDRPACYYIKKHKLENISSHKYLGIIIQDDLQCDSHVREVKAKATKLLGLLRRNLSHCSSKVKEQAYNSLVGPRVCYTCVGPLREATNRITGDYSRYSSVTQMRDGNPWMGDT